VMTAALV